MPKYNKKAKWLGRQVADVGPLFGVRNYQTSYLRLRGTTERIVQGSLKLETVPFAWVATIGDLKAFVASVTGQGTQRLYIPFRYEVGPQAFDLSAVLAQLQPSDVEAQTPRVKVIFLNPETGNPLLTLTLGFGAAGAELSSGEVDDELGTEYSIASVEVSPADYAGLSDDGILEDLRTKLEFDADGIAGSGFVPVPGPGQDVPFTFWVEVVNTISDAEEGAFTLDLGGAGNQSATARASIVTRKDYRLLAGGIVQFDGQYWLVGNINYRTDREMELDLNRSV